MTISQLTSPPEAIPVPDEEALLVREAQRDLSAFTTLYQRHVQKVYRYLLVRLGNEQDAQDLTSQTFLTAMEQLQAYRGEGRFAAWLLGIARHKLMDRYRRQKPELLLETADSVPDAVDAPDEIIDRRLQIEVVARKLQTLAPDRAEALSLRLFAGLDIAEIAGVMDRNEAAVRMLVFRGLRDLQSQLGDATKELS